MRGRLPRALLALALGLLTAAAAGAPAAPAMDPALWNDLALARPARPVEAPPLTLRSLAGDMTDLKDLRGRVVLVYFWTTW